MRLPVPPRLVPFAVVLLTMDVISSVAMGTFGGQGSPGALGSRFLAWLGLNSLFWGPPLPGLLLYARLARRRPEALARRPALAWALFYASVLGPAAAGCVARAGLAVAWLGVPGSLALLVGLLPCLILPLYYTEREAAFRREHAAQQAAIEQEVGRLFVSRAALLETRARTAYEVLAQLADHVVPEVEALQARLDALRQPDEAPTDAALAGLQEALDALSDGQVRRLSHLLHPSIIQAGLVPALRSLAGRYQGRVRVAAEAPGLPAEGGGLQLTAYRIVEAALDGLFAREEAPGSTVEIRVSAADELTVTLARGGDALERALGTGTLHREIIDSRVSLAGGRWGFEPDAEGATALSFRFPLAR